jgi:hypothetical protein
MPTDQGAGDHQTPSGRAAVSVQGAGPTAASSAVASAANTASGVGGPRECAGCGKRITERYLLKVSVCGGCGKRITEGCLLKESLCGGCEKCITERCLLKVNLFWLREAYHRTLPAQGECLC